MQEQEAKRFNGREYVALRVLFGVISEFGHNMPALEPRLKSLPNAFETAKALEIGAEFLMEQLLATMPTEQLRTAQANVRHLKVQVSEQRASNEPEFTYLPVTALEALLHSVLTWECSLCGKPVHEARKCPLKAAIDASTFHRLPAKTCCPYRDAHLVGLAEGDPA